MNTERFAVKVTLKNGRSYYRYYNLAENDKDVIWPIISSEEYISNTYLLTEEDVNGCYDFRIERYDDYQKMSNENIDRNKVRAIMEAYNQDLRMYPEVILQGQGRVLAQINCEIEDSKGDDYSIYMDVYDGMTETIRALQENGFGKWVEEYDVSEIDSLQLNLGYFPDINATPEQLIALARDNYGLREDWQVREDIVYQEAVQIMTAEVGGEPYILITDKAEIAEILQYCSYTSSYRSSFFNQGTIRILFTKENGDTNRLYLRRGALPEKYILRFGEIDLSEYGVAEYYYEKY